MVTKPPAPRLTMTRFGTVWPATQLTLEAFGLDAAVGYTMKKPSVVVSVAVTLMTTAVVFPGTLVPANGTSMDAPGPNLGPPRVSKTRVGFIGLNLPGAPATKVNRSEGDVALVPKVVVTVTSMVPSTCAGLTAVI